MLVKTKDIFNTPEILKLGKEPDDKTLVSKYLYDKIHTSKLPIKELLLDQSIINGLGNIYVDEVLFASHILPTRSGNTITLEEFTKVVHRWNEKHPKEYPSFATQRKMRRLADVAAKARKVSGSKGIKKVFYKIFG